MAIDIKTLRIGSHVSIDGKRVRVVGIRTTSSMSGLPIVQYTTDGVVRFGELPSDSADINPIEITPALLEELVFEDDKTDMVMKISGYYVFFHQINNLRWRVLLEEENCTVYGNTLCRYLHEAEAFLALHGVELIKD